MNEEEIKYIFDKVIEYAGEKINNIINDFNKIKVDYSEPIIFTDYSSTDDYKIVTKIKLFKNKIIKEITLTPYDDDEKPEKSKIKKNIKLRDDIWATLKKLRHMRYLQTSQEGIRIFSTTINPELNIIGYKSLYYAYKKLYRFFIRVTEKFGKEYKKYDDITHELYSKAIMISNFLKHIDEILEHEINKK
jgi:hypothetical protein